VTQPVGRLVLHERVGQIDLDGVDQRLEDSVPDHTLDLAILDLVDLGPEVGAQLVHRVELRRGLRERIVGVRKFQGLHVLHENAERRLSGELVAEPLPREVVVDAHDVAGLGAGQLGVHPLAELTRSDRVEVVVTRQPLDLGAGLGGGDVDRHEVTLLRGALDRLELGELPAEAFDPGVDLFIRDLRRRPLHLDALVVRIGQLQAGPDVDRRGEDEGLAGLELFDVDLGLTDRGQVFVGHRCAEIGWHGGVHEFLEHDVGPDLRVDDRPGGLPGPEPGDLHLARDRAVGLVQVLGHLVRGNLDRQLDGVLRGSLDGGLHGCIQATGDPPSSRS
jgi:hypothetical protein